MKDDPSAPASTRAPGEPLLAGVVEADTPALTAASAILNSQFEVMCTSREAALQADNPEFLHDFRVAARRFRAGLRLFRPLLRMTPAEACGRRVAELRRQLGAIRDAHVWLLFLEEIAAKQPLVESEHFREYLGNCRETDRKQNVALRAVLRSGLYMMTTDVVIHLLHVELPQAMSAHEDGPLFGPYAAMRLGKRFRKLLKVEARVKHMDDEAIHTLRKACRRIRYYAEFSAGSLGKPVDRLAKRLKQVTTTLGSVHDMDVRLEARSSTEIVTPPIVTEWVHKHRLKALKDFEKAWHDLAAGKQHREVMTLLREATQTPPSRCHP